MVRRLNLASRPKAFAMALFIAILGVVTVTSAVVLLSTDGDRIASVNERARSEARLVAVSALDDTYARVVADGVGATSAAIDTDAWYAFGPDGRIACPADQPDMCFQVEVTSTTRDISGLLEAGSADVEVTVRHSCRRDDVTTCRFLRQTQHLEARSFFPFLYYTTYSTLDPALYTTDLAVAAGLGSPANAEGQCADRPAAGGGFSTGTRNAACVNVAFVTGDNVDGGIYTLDTNVYVCGSPTLTTPVWAWNNGANAGGALQAASGCATALTPTQTVAGHRGDPELRLPAPATATGWFTPMASSTVANADGTTVTLEGDRFSVNGVDRGAIGSVIVLDAGDDGNVTVRGQSNRSTTIYSTGNVTIDGDVTIDGPAANSCSIPNGSATMIGVAARNDVQISANVAQGDTAGRCIQAVLVAFDGSIHVPGWHTATDDLNPAWAAPPLRLRGALLGKYQGVFAGYHPNTGKIWSGYQKDFSLDERLTGAGSSTALQPPYLLSPLTGGGGAFDVSSAWRRLDAAEVAVSDAEACQLQGRSTC